MKNTYTFTAPGPTTTTFSFSEEAAQMAIIELHRIAAEDRKRHTNSLNIQDKVPAKTNHLHPDEQHKTSEVSLFEYEVAFLRYLQEHHANGEEFVTENISKAIGLKVKDRTSPGQTVISQPWFKKFFDYRNKNGRTYRFLQLEYKEEFSKFSLTEE